VRVVCVRCVWSEECENVWRRDVVRVGVDVCEMSCWVVCLLCVCVNNGRHDGTGTQ
jgi:hypothetical protein